MNIVITGSTRGIGRGLAQYFLEKGHRVIINGTSKESVQYTVKKLSKKYKQSVKGFSADVCSYEAMEELWIKSAHHFGQVDMWINNAGINQEREWFKQLKIQNVEHLIDINIKGVINGSHVAVKHMLNQGFGQIYNMEGFGSNATIMPKMTVYGTSKAAVTYFTKSLAREVEDTGVVVGRLSPGIVVTDLLLHSMSKDEKEAQKNKKVFNILADDVTTVTQYLGRKILDNTSNNVHIQWLTVPKILYRFLTAPFIKRDLFSN